ncbi:hypothetical protein T484DRAFT_1875846 [Baffinella frigidus]|nr:hypothetical protein T484DRAFT_1875846 [Cryptophyta sp. CCMP2293]
MFQDIVHMQNLFSSGWPTTTITDNALIDGNQGGAWNYGASAAGDMGGIQAGNAVYADHTIGAFGVSDTAYSGEGAYKVGGSSMNTVIGVDAGTVASTAGHGISGPTVGIP